MIFRQLFEPLSSTYTYLLACPTTKLAVLIDPVIVSIERDLALINQLGLTLLYTLETHVHADHITAALEIKKQSGSKIAVPAFDALDCADVLVADNDLLSVGSLAIRALHTPGHTAGHFAYVCGERVFTGDALLIDGCGRTDFQGGDAQQLYKSVTEKLFSLPDDYLVYPGHDYQQRFVSSIAQEKQRNPRLGNAQSLAAFQTIMAELKLPHPKFMQYAVPGNQQCGVCPDHLPENLQNYCQQMTESPQG
jgi:glyoxylase-like metal-dependent hydrolase (beta-lactamase superfamily II)